MCFSIQAFGSAIVPPDSEIARARKAVLAITRAVVNDISAVPLNSPLRTDNVEIFSIFGALQTLHDAYVVNGTEEGVLDNWGEFWSRAEPVVLSLGTKLDEDGFGLDLGKEGEGKDGERQEDSGKKGKK